MMMSRVALFLMFFGTAPFLSFVKGRSPNGERDVKGDAGSDGTQQHHDPIKTTEAKVQTTVTVDNQTDFDQDGARDAFRAFLKHVQPNQQDLAAFTQVSAFSLGNVNLYISGLMT